jgi:hypothetical protein
MRLFAFGCAPMRAKTPKKLLTGLPDLNTKGAEIAEAEGAGILHRGSPLIETDFRLSFTGVV